MVKFVCKKCNYRFESDCKKKACPYCGQFEVIEEPNAQELLEE